MVRHGEAHCNIIDVAAEAGDCVRLTPRGHRQAATVAAALANEQRVVAVYTSSARRALQAAGPISDALDAPVVPTLPCRVLGHARGRAWKEVRALIPLAVELTPDIPVAPDAESWSRWVQRLGAHLDRLDEAPYGQRVGLVCQKASAKAAEQWFQRGPHRPERCVLAADFASITEWARCSIGISVHQRWLWARLWHNEIGDRALDSNAGFGMWRGGRPR